MGNRSSILYVLPELSLAAGAALLFLLSAFAPRWRRQGGFAVLAGALIAGALAALLFGPGCHRFGCPLFYGLLANDNLSWIFRALVLLATLVGVVLSAGHRSVPAERRGEFYGLLLVLALGMCLLSAANHLLMIYLAMETVSLCSYLLTGWESPRERSSEAAVKYALYGGVASAVMLFGLSLLYGLLGGLSLQQLNSTLMNDSALAAPAARWGLMVALSLVLCGFGYKVAAAPFHMWCPDAYQGAPTPFSALLSVGPKAAGFAVLLRFFYGLLLEPQGLENQLEIAGQLPWLLLVGTLSAITMTLGNLSAIVQNNLKRLLAYSSIAHAGYILMGVVAGRQAGFEAVVMYLAVYLLMNMGAFAVVAAVEQSAASEEMDAYRGLAKRAPLLALCMAVFLVSLTGLPPTAGFVGKLYLFAALIGRGDAGCWALALVGIVNSVVSLFYYARILKAMYLEQNGGGAVSQKSPAAVAAALLALPVLVLGIFWHPLAEVANWSAVFFH